MTIDPVRYARKRIVAFKTQKLQRFLDNADHCREIQQGNLLRRIAESADTDFGRDHGFRSIRSIDDYRRQVPITGYEEHRPYIERVQQGNLEALLPAKTRVLMFATTSGTTDKPKKIPVTDSFYRQYKASWQYWGTGVFRDYEKLLQLKTLQFSSRYDVEFEGKIPCGNISGLAAETRPFYMGSLFVLPKSVIKISDHVAKHYTALRLSLASDRLGMIVTANPSTLIEVAKHADRRKEALIRDIHNGTLTPESEIPAWVRNSLRGRLRKNAGRARELERIVNQTGSLYPKDAWPDLQVLAVWTGGSVQTFIDKLPRYYGNVPIRDHGISASEGRMTIPLQDGSPEGVLDYASHYYEFVPQDELDSANPTILEAHELEPGQDYFILLSTSSGLYRYNIHDLVRCHGFQGNAPLLSFLNKGKNFSSLTGEKLSEWQVNEAMRLTREKFGLVGFTFTVAPSFEQTLVRYRLVITRGEVRVPNDELCAELQRQLCGLNTEYEDKCDSGRIIPIAVQEVVPGTFDRQRALKSQARGNFEEYKHPMLSGDLNFLDEIDKLSREVADEQLEASIKKSASYNAA